MAKIFISGAPMQDDAALTEARTFAINYWGSLKDEKIFPIAFWKVKQMLAASNSKKIALRFTDIDDPNLIDGLWIVFEDSLSDTLRDPVEENVYYYVLDDSLFIGPLFVPVEGDGIKKIDGLWTINDNPSNNIIRARIGKDPADNKVYVFLQAAICNIIGPGGGGEGASTGFKVPTPGG